MQLIYTSIYAAIAVSMTGCGSSSKPSTDAPSTAEASALRTSKTACPTGDGFCRGQNLNGGDFSGSYCKYWMEDKVCQAPHLSTDEGMAHIACSCDAKPLACPTGDAFCQSQTVNGGDFSGSYCKYWMEDAKCQAPHMSTDEAMAQISCSCDGASSTVAPKATTSTVIPKATTSTVAPKATTSTVAPKATTSTVAPTTTTTTTTTTTEAAVVGPSGIYCGKMKIAVMMMEGSLTVTDSTFDISVGGFVEINGVGYTMDKQGNFDIDFTNPDIAKFLEGLKMTAEDAKSKITASYDASSDRVKVTLPVGELVVSKDQC